MCDAGGASGSHSPKQTLKPRWPFRDALRWDNEIRVSLSEAASQKGSRQGMEAYLG